jgi:hypothetical protein
VPRETLQAFDRLLAQRGLRPDAIVCDRGFDLPDCVAMNPTADELADLLPWLTVADLSRRLGHGL